MAAIAATIKDVANYCGLSTATISKYINGVTVKEENRIRIEEAINKLGFKVNEIARGLKTNKTMTIGVLIPSLENIFSTTIVSHIEDILLQNGYSTIICDYKYDSEQESKKFDFLINKAVDGIIIMPSAIMADQIKVVQENNIPVVLIDRVIKGLECDVVLVDNLNASYDAVEHLITKGHKRVGIICGPQDIYTAQERLKGYIRVHEDYNMQVDESIIKYGDYEIEGGYKLVNELLDCEEPPTAVFVTNYEMTLGAIMAVNERNINIPEDLSFIGFDNIQLAKVVRPNIAIVAQPLQQIGETVAQVLLKRLKGDNGNFPAMFRLKTNFMDGQSIAEIS